MRAAIAAGVPAGYTGDLPIDLATALGSISRVKSRHAEALNTGFFCDYADV